MLKVFSQPFDLGEHQLPVEASIGISLYPQDGGDVETLLQHADKAIYAAKLTGNTYCSYAEIKANKIDPRD